MKKIIAIITVILVIMIAFWYLGNSNSTGSASDSSLSISQSTSDSPDAQYIYSLLQQMSQVKSQGNLDDSLFSNPIFVGLQDNTISFSAPPAGRVNPFAPLGSIGAPAGTSATIKVSIK